MAIAILSPMDELLRELILFWEVKPLETLTTTPLGGTTLSNE
jgi:hypothetical protein